MDESCSHERHNQNCSLSSRLYFYCLGILALAWLILRSGTRPSRIAYPCQRTAAAIGLNFLASYSPLLATSIFARTRLGFRASGKAERGSHMALWGILRCILLLSPMLFLFSEGSTASGIAQASTIEQAPIPDKIVSLPARPDPHPTVAIISRDHTPDEAEIAVMVEQAIDGALGPGGLANMISSGDVVLIKPNLGCGYKSHETADWRVVKPIVQGAKLAGASQVYIGEGEGCNYGLSVFDGAGYTTNITDVTYVNFNDIGSEPYYFVSVSGGLWEEPIAIPQVYFEADVVITVPKLKTHSAAGVTMGLKNAMGVPPVPLYSSGTSYRNLIHENYEVRMTIAQINLARTPDFAVIDAILAGEGQGPWAADPIEVDAILASRDLVAVDVVGTSVMGIDPMRIPYLVFAHEKNLGILDLDSIRIVGSQISAVQKNFSLPAEADTIYRKAAVLQRSGSELSVDGSFSDWGLIEPIVLDQSSDVLSGINWWDGPQDLSIESRFLYDQNALYAILYVRDEQKVVAPNPGQVPSQGDRLELDVSVADPWYRLNDPVYGENDFRFGMGYNQNPILWDLIRGAVVPSVQVNLVDSTDGYIVELMIPFSALNNYTPAENKQIGLDFSVVDVDGGVEETTIAWSGGVELPYDARLMGVGLLGPLRGCTNPQTVCVYLPMQSNQ